MQLLVRACREHRGWRSSPVRNPDWLSFRSVKRTRCEMQSLGSLGIPVEGAKVCVLQSTVQ